MISVVMTTYNGQLYVKDQVNSIVNQTIKPDEILIFDDGSTDDTLQILDQISNCYKCIKVFKNKKNLGYTMNFWQGIKTAKGQIIFLSDQDDIWKDNKIQKMTELFEKYPDMLTLNSGYITIDSKGNRINNFKDIHFSDSGKIVKVSFKDFIRSPRYPGMAMAVNKSLIDNLEINEKEIIHSHDWFLNLCGAYKEGMYFMDTVTSFYRQHGKNTYGTTANLPKSVLRKRRLGIIDEEVELNRIVRFLYHDSKYSDFINRQEVALRERKDAFLTGKLLNVFFCYFKNRKYLAKRDLLGDLYVLFR